MQYNKKVEGVSYLRGQGINTDGSSRGYKHPLAKSIKTRKAWQLELEKLPIPFEQKEELNILFEEMAMYQYDMGVQDEES